MLKDFEYRLGQDSQNHHSANAHLCLKSHTLHHASLFFSCM